MCALYWSLVWSPFWPALAWAAAWDTAWATARLNPRAPMLFKLQRRAPVLRLRPRTILPRPSASGQSRRPKHEADVLPLRRG